MAKDINRLTSDAMLRLLHLGGSNPTEEDISQVCFEMSLNNLVDTYLHDIKLEKKRIIAALKSQLEGLGGTETPRTNQG